MNKIIYLVTGTSGSYSDRSSWNEKAFGNLIDAEKLVEELSKREERINKAKSSIDEYIRGLEKSIPSPTLKHSNSNQVFYELHRERNLLIEQKKNEFIRTLDCLTEQDKDDLINYRKIYWDYATYSIEEIELVEQYDH